MEIWLWIVGTGIPIVLAAGYFLWRKSVKSQSVADRNEQLENTLEAERDTADKFARPRRSRDDIADSL